MDRVENPAIWQKKLSTAWGIVSQHTKSHVLPSYEGRKEEHERSI